MANPLAIDNSRLREQARQQRQELARLQQAPEKQPTKNLFGPPIPVSRPNDPTFEQLSNFFGSPVGADILCFRSTSNSDHSPTDESQSRNHRLAGARHSDSRSAEHSDSIRTKQGDLRRVEHSDSRRAGHRPSDTRHGDTRQADARQGDTRHGDARHSDIRHSDTRHGDTRHSDTRHADMRHGDAQHRDSRPSDSRSIHFSEPVVKNSRTDHSGTAPSSELGAEPPRQGVFEQFVKSSSKTSCTSNSNKAPRTSESRQHTTEEKLKLRMDSFKDSKLNGASSSVFNRSNGATDSKSDRHSKQPATNQLKYSSTSAPDSFQTSFPSHKINEVNNEIRKSPLRQINNFGKDYEKSVVWDNGVDQNVDLNAKTSEAEKKLTLRIPKEYEKCDDIVTKVLRDVSIPSPLTGILTPKKTDIHFPFPDTNQQCFETIPKDHSSSDEDHDDEAEEKVERFPIQRPEHLFDSTGKTIPNESLNVIDDLDISSDSENEQVETNDTDQRTPDGAGPRSVADQKSPGTVALADEARKSRRLSESSEGSSSEDSCTSESESDSSQSENEDNNDDKEMKVIDEEKDETDEAEAKQSKYTSWEIKNFIPKSNEQVPFTSLLSPPSSQSVNVIRQTSNDDFDIDIDDPIKEIVMMSRHQALSPLPISTSGGKRVESDHFMDEIHPSSPKVLRSPRITVNGQHSDALSTNLSPVDFPSSGLKPKRCSQSSLHGSSVLSPISGVDYCAGKPSVVVRIRRSYLSKKLKNTKHKDAVNSSACRIIDNVQVSASTVSSKSAVQSDFRSPTQAGCEPDISGRSPESVLKFSRSSATSNSSLPRSSSCRSSHADGTAIRTLGATPKPTSATPTPPPIEMVSPERKEQRVLDSPTKVGREKIADDTYLLASKATKRKSDDVGQPNQKKICDRSTVTRKEDRKSQSLLQNGTAYSSQKPQVTPDIKSELKFPVTNGEDKDSKAFLSSQVLNQTDKTKAQDGQIRADEKMKKTSITKVNGKLASSDTPNSVSGKSAKFSTPVMNGNGKSPSHQNPVICFDDGLSNNHNDNRKQTTDDDEVDHLLFNQKNPVNGIKRVKQEPEKLESSDVYLQNARKLKHEGDSGPDKFSKGLSYTESVLAFICHCSALEAERAELARIQKMYQDTLALCQYIVRVMESVPTPEKYHLIVINLRLQAIISLRLYNVRKADVGKLKSVLDEHNRSHMSKPLQIPSPYQTGHHFSTNSTAASWNHANGTPSPRSPRPSPSPAGSIGSVGSAGSSNGDSGIAKSMSLTNGHGVTSIVVPQRIHSVMMNFLNYMNYLHQCHDYWDQAEALLAAHPTVADFFHSVDTDFGPIDLHSSTLAVVRYVSEVVKHVRNEAKRSSQVVRTC